MTISIESLHTFILGLFSAYNLINKQSSSGNCFLGGRSGVGGAVRVGVIIPDLPKRQNKVTVTCSPKFIA